MMIRYSLVMSTYRLSSLILDLKVAYFIVETVDADIHLPLSTFLRLLGPLSSHLPIHRGSYLKSFTCVLTAHPISVLLVGER